MTYEVAEKIVKSGDSKVFKNWSSVSTITEDDFLAAIKWLCEDPEDGGVSGDRMTREIGLTQTGVVKLHRNYGPEGLCAFYDESGHLWSGALFRTPCPERYKADYADADGMYTTIQKISISVRDHV